MRSYEFTAKTVEKAIKLGLETLNKKQEYVDIKIVNEGGLFKKAKIVINIEDEPKFTSFKKAEQKPEAKPQPAAEVKAEPAQKQEKPQQQPKVEQKKVVAEKVDSEQNLQQPIAQEQPAAEKPAKVLKNNETSVEFINGLLNAMGVNATVTLKETKDNSQITIETEDAGSVIGYRGECLSAIQYLANNVEQKNNRNAKRVVVDAGDYKKRREQQLRDLAIKVAGKVEATGRPHKFEPMNAYERRIIHTELQNYSAVDTHSEGEEPNRRLIVTKKAK